MYGKLTLIFTVLIFIFLWEWGKWIERQEVFISRMRAKTAFIYLVADIKASDKMLYEVVWDEESNIGGGLPGMPVQGESIDLSQAVGE